MKFILFVLTFSLLTFSALAAEEEVPVPQGTTQAGWFSPGCPDCVKMQNGPAALWNTKGVFRPGDNPSTKKKKKAAVSK